MLPITLWYRKNEKGNYDYNHLEDGHCSFEVPTMNSELQRKAWRCEWRKEFKYLSNDIPPKVI